MFAGDKTYRIRADQLDTIELALDAERAGKHAGALTASLLRTALGIVVSIRSRGEALPAAPAAQEECLDPRD